MKWKYRYVFYFLLMVTGCANDTHQFSTTAEEVLPGRWRIESVSLPANPEGITYQGKTFFNDTVLFDIGEFEFGTFNFHISIWDSPESTPITCNLTLETENFTYIIDNLYIGGREMYGSFDQIVPGGIDIVDTPAEEFIWSSGIFSSNYSLLIEGTQHLRLEKFDWPASSVIEMEKIE